MHQVGDALRAMGQNPTESEVKKLTSQHKPGTSSAHPFTDYGRADYENISSELTRRSLCKLIYTLHHSENDDVILFELFIKSTPKGH